METIVFKVANGTKARLRRINANLSELMRSQAQQLIEQGHRGNAFQKAEHLCGSVEMSRTASTSKEYRRQYARKNSH